MLKAMANPLRRQALAFLAAVESARATDLAQRLDVAANKLSFHLRVLAAAGLIEEAPELARDRRDRVWRIVPGGLNIASPGHPTQPQDQLPLLAYLDQERHDQHRRIDAVVDWAAEYATTPDPEPRALLSTSSMLLDAQELEEFTNRVSELIRSMKREHSVPAAEAGERKLWNFSMIMAREDLPGLGTAGELATESDVPAATPQPGAAPSRPGVPPLRTHLLDDSLVPPGDYPAAEPRGW